MAAYTLTTAKRVPSWSDGQGVTVTTTYDLSPGSAFPLVLRLLAGGPRQVGPRLVYDLPHRDPQYRWCFCKKVSLEPLEDDVPSLPPGANSLLMAAQYDRVRLVCEYGPPQFDSLDANNDTPEAVSPEGPPETDLGSFSWQFSARNLTLPNQYFAWIDGAPSEAYPGTGSPAPSSPGSNDLMANSGIAATKTYPGIEVVVTRHLCLRKPTQAILGNMGRVNLLPFKLAGDTWPNETLRFDSAQVSRKWTSYGLKYFDITYKFAVQAVYDKIKLYGGSFTTDWVGWNRVFDPWKGYWRRVVWHNDVTRGIYLHDEAGPAQKIRGKDMAGFKLLFDKNAK